MTKKDLPLLHNMGIVVESLDNTIDFFSLLGLKLEGRMMVEGEWAGRVTGLEDQSVEIAMMVTPDGHSRLELSRFIRPEPIVDHRTAPVNSLGYLRLMFTVDDIDGLVSRLIAPNWWARLFNMKMPIGFAISAELREFLSVWQKSCPKSKPLL
jgi:catechol 2,3-dioxygenase-like lactoylglutathione lyase family enzyme